MKKFFSEIPHIVNGSLELRKAELSDVNGLRELVECDEVYRYLPTFLFEKKYDSAEEVITRLYDECLESSLILGIFYNGEFCGLAEFYGYSAPFLKISVGYRLIPRFWGKGIASETLGMMVDWLFCKTDIKIITASVMPENKASAGVLKKNGFKCAVYSVFENWGYPHLTKADKYIKTAKDYRKGYSFKDIMR